jgi:hypothetical protein
VIWEVSYAKEKRDGWVFQAVFYFQGISTTCCGMFGLDSKATAYLKFYGTQNCGTEDCLSNYQVLLMQGGVLELKDGWLI